MHGTCSALDTWVVSRSAGFASAHAACSNSPSSTNNRGCTGGIAAASRNLLVTCRLRRPIPSTIAFWLQSRTAVSACSDAFHSDRTISSKESRSSPDGFAATFLVRVLRANNSFLLPPHLSDPQTKIPLDGAFWRFTVEFDSILPEWPRTTSDPQRIRLFLDVSPRPQANTA